MKTLAFDGAPFSSIGIALSVFLGFRNRACYERWWEGRMSWGNLILHSRTFARQSLLLERTDTDPSQTRALMLQKCFAFAHALVRHLRPGGGVDSLTGAASAHEYDTPTSILAALAKQLAELRHCGTITDVEFQMFEQTLRDMAAVQVTCERLQNTPLPFGYTLLLHRTAYAFCFLLPFGYADTLHWGTPIVTALIAYTFFGLDALGDELEQPFGHHPNTLSIGAMAINIEIEMRQALGETDLPAPPRPTNHILT